MVERRWGLVGALQVGTRAAQEPAPLCPAAVDERLEGVARMSYGYGSTVRESDIFALMARRCASVEIAETLVVSMATVRTHVRNIYAKFDVRSAKKSHALVGARLGPLADGAAREAAEDGA